MGLGRLGQNTPAKAKLAFYCGIKKLCFAGVAHRTTDGKRSTRRPSPRRLMAMTPPLRFSCESLHDTRPGQGAGATAGPSRGRTGKVQRSAGEDRAPHHCLRRRRPQAPCAQDQRRFVAEFAGRAGEGTLVVWFSTGCRGLNFWAGHQREGQGDQAAPGSCSTGALIASHAVPCCKILGRWSLPRTRRSSVSRNPFQRLVHWFCAVWFSFSLLGQIMESKDKHISWLQNQIEKVQEPTEKALHPRLLQSHILHVFFFDRQRKPANKRRRSHSSQRPRIFFHTALLSDLLRFS